MNLLQIYIKFISIWIREKTIKKILFIFLLGLFISKDIVLVLFVFKFFSIVFFQNDDFKFLINLPIKTEDILKVKVLHVFIEYILGAVVAFIMLIVRDEVEIYFYIFSVLKGMVFLLIYIPSTCKKEFLGNGVLNANNVIFNMAAIVGIYIHGSEAYILNWILGEVVVIVVGFKISYNYALKKFMGSGYEKSKVGSGNESFTNI